MILDLIQKPAGTLDILVFLSKEGPSDVTTILKGLGIHTKTFYSAAGRLKSLGLVFERTEVGWPTRVYYGLTYKGEEAVKHLLPLETMIENSMSAQWRELEELESKRMTQAKKRRMLEILRDLQESTFDIGEWDTTLELSEKSIRLAKSLKDESSLSHAHRWAGLVFQKRCDFPKAEENLEKSLEISSRNEDWEDVAEDHYVLGALYERAGDLEKAGSHYSKSMDFAKKAMWTTAEAKAELGLGRVLGRKGDYEGSRKRIERATKKLERTGAIDELARAYGDLGSTLFFIDKDRALESFEKSVEIARKTGEVRMIAFGLSNASSCYIGKNELKKAWECVREAEDIFGRLDESPAIASIYIHRGCIQKLEGKWKDAEESFQKSIDLSEKANAKYHLADALFHYGTFLSERSRIPKAAAVLRRAMATFEELGNESKASKVRAALESLNQ